MLGPVLLRRTPSRVVLNSRRKAAQKGRTALEDFYILHEPNPFPAETRIMDYYRGLNNQNRALMYVAEYSNNVTKYSDPYISI